MAKEESEAVPGLGSILSRELQAQGFFVHGFLDRSSFREVLDRYPRNGQDSDRYDLGAASTIVAVALRYGEGSVLGPDWASSGGEGEGLAKTQMMTLARFARANWYAEIDKRLHAALKSMKSKAEASGIAMPGLKTWKRLTNSGLPEKALALKANLGWVGKNNILIASGQELCSSAVLLGLILCPVELRGPTRTETKSRCGVCRKCIDACPTMALGREDGSFCRAKCIQHWTHIDGEPPEYIRAFLSSRLYGCDICLEACPYFLTDDKAECSRGILGKSIPAGVLLGRNDEELKAIFRGTVLDRSWISLKALRRNATISQET